MPPAITTNHPRRQNNVQKRPSKKTPVVDSDVLTLAEAAALLRVHPFTLRKRAVNWGVPHRRMGAEWRFSREVLTAWVQGRDAVREFPFP